MDYPRPVNELQAMLGRSILRLVELLRERSTNGQTVFISIQDADTLETIASRLCGPEILGVTQWCEVTNELCTLFHRCAIGQVHHRSETSTSIRELLLAVDQIQIHTEFLFELTGFQFFRSLHLRIRQALFMLEEVDEVTPPLPSR